MAPRSVPPRGTSSPDRVPAEDGPQRALHGAGEIEELHVRVGR